MIVNIIILIIICCLLYFIYNRFTEHYHELDKHSTTSKASSGSETNKVEDPESCNECEYCDFNPNPEGEKYILGKCIKQHTTKGGKFIPKNENCASHEIYSGSSGCKQAAIFFSDNVETLKNIVESSGKKCDSNSLEQIEKKVDESDNVNYSLWKDSLNEGFEGNTLS